MSCHRYQRLHSRRDFLAQTGLGLGTAALASLLGRDALGAPPVAATTPASSSTAGGGATGTLPGMVP